MPRLVIGVGVNVNNSLQAAPEEVRSQATSLVDAAGRQVDRTELLLQILQRLASILQQLSAPEFSLAEHWQPYCMLQGRELCLQGGGRRVVGVCLGIDREGALLLQTESGLESCFAGVVTRIDG